MSLATLADVLHNPSRTGAVAAYNVIQIEHAEAYVRAAEQTRLPVVMQISENCVRYHGSLRPIASATLALADACGQAVVVHLDHATDPALVDEAIEVGLTSVMFDGSQLPDAQNRELTAQVVARCHARGVSVEAELGEVGGKDGVHAPGVRTDPDDARRFVADTGVDLLAVAVGSSHAMTTRDAALDLDLIRAIAAAVPVPLVLHGSSGVSDEGIRAAIRAGMTKINVSTHLNHVFTDRVRSELDANPALVDSRKWIAPAARAMQDEVERMLAMYQAA